MRLKSILRSWLCLLPALLVAGSIFAESKIEEIGAFSQENLKGVLQDKGIRVIDDGKPLCDLWFVKSVPADDAKSESGILYPQFKTSSFVGVITFPSASKDFRGQQVQPGTYALRFALQPADGNHMGTAPDRDFLVLTPLDSNTNPNESLTFEQLMTVAKKASGGHPWSLILVSPPEESSAQRLSTNDSGHLILTTTMSDSKGAAFPFALIVKGVTDSL